MIIIIIILSEDFLFYHLLRLFQSILNLSLEIEIITLNKKDMKFVHFSDLEQFLGKTYLFAECIALLKLDIIKFV